MGKASDNLEAFVHPYDGHTRLVDTLTRATDIAKSLRITCASERGRAVEQERQAAFTRAARVNRLRSALGGMFVMVCLAFVLSLCESFWVGLAIYIGWCLATLGLVTWAAVEVEKLA